MSGRVGRRDGDPVRLGLAPVFPDHRVRIEPPRDGRRVMKPAQRNGHTPDGFGPPHLFERDRAALDEPGHEPALVLDEARHLRTHPHLGCAQAGLVLRLAVDPEQAGLGAALTKDEGLAAHFDLEVVVGDAAGERNDARPVVRPQPLDGSGGVHARHLPHSGQLWGVLE